MLPDHCDLLLLQVGNDKAAVPAAAMAEQPGSSSHQEAAAGQEPQSQPLSHKALKPQLNPGAEAYKPKAAKKVNTVQTAGIVDGWIVYNMALDCIFWRQLDASKST